MSNNDSNSQRRMPVDLSMGLILYADHYSGQEEINSNNKINKPFVSENKYRDQMYQLIEGYHHRIM